MKRFFDHDPFTGITQFFHWHDDGTFTLEAVQDVEPVLEANKASFNQYSSGRDKWGDWHKVAHIPNVILEELMRDGKLWDQAYMKRWLNASENAAFRTRPGVV